ncbi:MAG TPA: hypothetical protein VK892_14450 [Pyrinomonadaceae bacterium]|nr:hypothetical protein [Pyrinomonadaceae bacterium]
MSQEETKENLSSDKSSADSTEENLNSEEVENLPVGSIGSYARIDELVTDEDAENSADSASET